MDCPHCGAAVAAQAVFCPHCGAALRVAGPPPGTGAAHEAMTAPLTIEQLNWLRANALLPIVALAVTLGGFGVVGFCITGGSLDSPFFATIFFKIFAGIVAVLLLAVSVAVAVHVRNNYADARAGVAQVRVARLLDKRATSGSNRSFYVKFDQIGQLTVLHAIYEPLVIGQHYQVTYSPRSRRGWSISNDQ